MQDFTLCVSSMSSGLAAVEHGTQALEESYFADYQGGPKTLVDKITVFCYTIRQLNVGCVLTHQGSCALFFCAASRHPTGDEGGRRSSSEKDEPCMHWARDAERHEVFRKVQRPTGASCHSGAEAPVWQRPRRLDIRQKPLDTADASSTQTRSGPSDWHTLFFGM